MRKYLVPLLLCSVLVPAKAKDMTSLLTPSPIGLVVSIGEWIKRNSEEVYHVKVKSSGRDEREAREQGFLLAVNHAIGSLVVSNKEIVNQDVVRKELFNYSSGYVDDFLISSRSLENGLIMLEMDVWVKKSQIADRVLNVSRDSGKIEGTRASIKISSLDHERKQGDLVLESVLADFPARAYKVDLKPTRVVYGPDRQRHLEVIFDINWSNEYANSLLEVLQKTSNGSGVSDSSVTIKGRPGKHGWKRTVNFDDHQKFAMIQQNLVNSRPAALVVIYDIKSKPVYRACFRYVELDGIMDSYLPGDLMVQSASQTVLINTWLRLNAKANIPIKSANIEHLDRAEVSIVRNTSCPN